MIFLPHTNTVILLEPYCGTITEPGLPVVSLDCSANQVVMQISELTIRSYFGPCSHVTETQTERQAKTSKKVKLHSNKTVIPLNAFTTCVVYILKRVVRS